MSTEPYDTDFDYLAAEGAIIARLTANVPGLEQVSSEASVASLQSGQLDTPAALVLWSHDTPEKNDDPEAPQRIEQTWLVCLVVSVADDKTGERARAQAGPLITRVIRAMKAWVPADGFEAFTFSAAIEPQLAAGGVLYIPIPFKTAFIL